MITHFHNKKISSVLCVLPEQEFNFDDEVDNYSFPRSQTMRLKKVMGFNKHRLSKSSSTVSDFSIYGLRYMFDNSWIKPEEIGAIIVVTLSPDHFVPQISNIVQGAFNLPHDIVCLDIAQGCCGFLLGLSQCFMYLDIMKDKKVLLISGDVLSHKVSKRDRNDFPLAGDGAAISVIENSDINPDIYFEINMDGSRCEALRVPAGAFRMPSTPETAEYRDAGDGNFRSLDNLTMDGTSVFNFVQVEVPPLIENTLKETNTVLDDYDLFLFHQPNKFMMKKLAQKVGIPFEKIPMNLVENYGNLSGACIPFVALLNYEKELKERYFKCFFSAFGSGLAWSSMTMEFGKLDNAETLISDL